TSSVAYCSDPIAILVTDLQLSFFPDNRTLEFSIAAASTQDDLNVSIALTVNAYGLGVFNANLNLCDLGGSFLCPLPQYQFSGGGVFPIPNQFNLDIPTIAYTIPDLEAVATLELTDTNRNSVVGCVQATLSNGHTARQPAVLWATVGFALLALFSCLLHTAMAQSVGAAQWRIVDVMMVIQHPAVTSLLSLNYPIVFLKYGSNFAWAIGLVNIPSLQQSITKTRQRYGDYSSGTFGAALTAQVGRKYNPFSGSTPQSGGSDGGGLGRLVEAGSGLMKRDQYAPNTGPNGFPVTNSNSVQLQVVGGNTTSGDLGRFAERQNVAPGNAYLTVLVSAAILLAILIGALIVLYIVALVARILTNRNGKGAVSHWSHRITRPREFLGVVTLSMLSRYFLIVFPILTIFSFYQWNYGSSWPPHLVAGLVFGLFLIVGAVFLVPMIKYARRGSADDLYFAKGEPPEKGTLIAKRWGHTAHPYRPKFYWFAFAFVLWSVVRACFIVFAQGHGLRQAAGLLAWELIFLILLLILRPGRDKKSDWFYVITTLLRMLTWAACIALTEEANVQTIPRVIVGFVVLVITGLPIIFLFFVTLWDFFSALLPSKRRPIKDRTDHTGKEEVGESGYAYGNVAGTGPRAAPHSSEESGLGAQANVRRSSDSTAPRV
ncbi:TRP-domain-containing protein, partial [Ceraceosorus guamensis]